MDSHHSHLVLAMMLLAGCAAGSSAGTHGGSSGSPRRLTGVPLPVPRPFGKPSTVAESAQATVKSGGVDAYAQQMCQMFASPAYQGTREFEDIQGVFIYPMIQSVARAAYTSPADVVPAWGKVAATCNSQAAAAEGLGYAAAYVYTEGVVESLGLTQILDAAYKLGGGCKAVDRILDVAAAVIRQRTVGPNQLASVMTAYSKQLAACTPRDAQIKFVPVNPVAAAVAAKQAREAAVPTVAKAAAVQMKLSVPAVATEAGNRR